MCQSFCTSVIRTCLFFITITSISVLSACGGGGGSGGGGSPVGGGNSPVIDPPPVASANPTVTASTPTDKSMNVSPGLQQITATFDKAIDPDSLSAGTFRVSNGVTGTITTATNNTQVVFTPDAALSRNTEYTVTLDGVMDTNGMLIAANNQQAYSWSFTTCGNTSSSTYTVSWNSVADTDLSGYKVYYGLAMPLTRANAASVTLGNVTNWVFNPADFNYLPCDPVQVSISSLGSTKSESNLSQPQQIIID